MVLIMVVTSYLVSFLYMLHDHRSEGITALKHAYSLAFGQSGKPIHNDTTDTVQTALTSNDDQMKNTRQEIALDEGENQARITTSPKSSLTTNNTNTTAQGTPNTNNKLTVRDTDEHISHNESELDRIIPQDSHGVRSYQNITFYPPDCDKKLLVYHCPTGGSCGGIADRQKAIISTFILSLLTNRTFVIDNIVPCNIENVLPPNLYDWTKCRQNLTNNSNDTLDLNLGDANLIKDKLILYTGGDLWREHVVNLRMIHNIQKIMKAFESVTKVLPWLVSIPVEKSTKHVIELLFKHGAKLSDSLHTFQHAHIRNRYMVCTHLRTGLARDNTLQEADYVEKMFAFLESYLKELDKPYILYIASDSSENKRLAKLTFPNAVTLNGTVEHVDQTNDTSCGTTFQTIFEQTVLSQCDAIFMSGSGFSRMAAIIGGKAQDIFIPFNQFKTDSFLHKYGSGKGGTNYTLHSMIEAFGII